MRALLTILIVFLLSPNLVKAQLVDFVTSLDPSSPVLGQSVSLDIHLNAGSTQVNSAGAFLNFDPSVLQVTGFTQGNELPALIYDSTNNQLGQFDIAIGKFSDFPSGNFLMVSVHFDVVGPTASSNIAFVESSDRESMILNHIGADVTGNLPVTNYEVNATCSGNLVLTNTPSDNQYYLSSGTILSTQNISNGIQVTFDSQISTTMDPNFMVNTGSTLTVHLEGCTN